MFAVRPGFEGARHGLTGGGSLVGAVVGSMVSAPLLGVGLGFVAGRLGLALLRRYGRRRCSETSCHSVIPHGATKCPGCHGVVRGVIDGHDARLDALEAYEEGRT